MTKLWSGHETTDRTNGQTYFNIPALGKVLFKTVQKNP